jgi:membrane-bound serine protease (ClpP class)
MTPNGLKRSLFFLIAGLFLAPVSFADEPATVTVIQIDDYIINPVVAEYIQKAVGRAEARRDQCLVIELDTPGGLLSSTRKIVRTINNAKVPVVVYIAPNGARAGSAGVFITLASHVAAMAPSTNIGAAHPVEMGRGEKRSVNDTVYEFLQYLKKKQEEEGLKPAGAEKDGESVMGEKVMNDTLAWVRSLAEARSRNAEWAERAVSESASQTENEAVRMKIVEFIARDRADLLQKLDGREIVLASGEKRVLRTKEAVLEVFPLGAAQNFLNTLIHPSIAYILMLVGFYGILFEVTHPGVGFPGVIGAISLILAFYAFQMLPVNYAGVALVLLAIFLFIAELKVQSFGLLTLGGILCMVLGSLMLFDVSESFLRLSLSFILPFVFGSAGLTLFLGGAVLRAHRRKATTGAEGLKGLRGAAENETQVFVHGEIWNAVCEEPLRKGDPVEVIGVEGLTLRVKKLNK